MGAPWYLCTNTFIPSLSRQELASFLDQPDVITHVALVKPKPNLFVDDITSILVICTPLTIILIGVALVPGQDGQPTKQLGLYATDFTLQTDVEMTSVVGTADGRIFMVGLQDGNVYELHYQATETWFAKRMQLINHSVGGVQSLLPRFATTANEGAAVEDRQCEQTLTLSFRSRNFADCGHLPQSVVRPHVTKHHQRV